MNFSAFFVFFGCPFPTGSAGAPDHDVTQALQGALQLRLQQLDPPKMEGFCEEIPSINGWQLEVSSHIYMDTSMIFGIFWIATAQKTHKTRVFDFCTAMQGVRVSMYIYICIYIWQCWSCWRCWTCRYWSYHWNCTNQGVSVFFCFLTGCLRFL